MLILLVISCSPKQRKAEQVIIEMPDGRKQICYVKVDCKYPKGDHRCLMCLR